MMKFIKRQVSSEIASRPVASDFFASIVVFLVALPLSMGVAIASGVPPALGLVTAIVGGIVVGFIAGSPLQVSGPAAGLTVMVWQIVSGNGIEALGAIVLLAGLFQLVAGFGRLGQWFRAVSPALINGMLAGIGVLIFASQFHVMLDQKGGGSGLANLISIPESVLNAFASGSGQYLAAGAIGLTVVLIMVGWTKYAKGFFKLIPGALVAVIVATFVGFLANFSVNRVVLPSDLTTAINLISPMTAMAGIDWTILGLALALAMVASAESLLCASAVDQMHKGPRTNYDKELVAQGFGNVICGALGALPMTGVIVRSSANVLAGAKTKWSAIFHGMWLLVFVVSLPWVLNLIPTAALAAILVVTGIKLLNVAELKKLWASEKSEALVFIVTLGVIVSVDLLSGIFAGFAVLALKTLILRSKLQIDINKESSVDQTEICLSGAATFMHIPKLARAIDSVPIDRQLCIDLDRVDYMDLACRNLLESRRKLSGHQMTIKESPFIQ